MLNAMLSITKHLPSFFVFFPAHSQGTCKQLFLQTRFPHNRKSSTNLTAHLPLKEMPATHAAAIAIFPLVHL